MPKHTTVDKKTSVRVVIVTLDNHLASAADRARTMLSKDLPGLQLTLHAASEWDAHPDLLKQCHEDIAKADIIVATMLFMEEHIKPVIKQLQARKDNCDAFVGAMSAREIMLLTRIGDFAMGGPQSGAISLLKKLSGAGKKTQKTKCFSSCSDQCVRQCKSSSGAGQMAMLRRLPKILKFIPGKAQDVRAYFLSLQYWLAGSDDNVANMVKLLVNRYSADDRSALKGTLKVDDPTEYPDIGVYHPRLKSRIVAELNKLPRTKKKYKGAVGLLIMRSYVLAGNSRHYDAVIDALEKQGMRVIAAFSSGLDSRPAIEKFFIKDDEATVDAVVSLTGFSLVGGPAYNDSKAAAEILARLDVPYIAAQPLEFQSLEQWEGSGHGLMPVEATMMVAIPEIDGATAPSVYGGRSDNAEQVRDMQPHPERISALADRVTRMVTLRNTPRADRKLAMVIFNFPPNAGSTGTAAYLSVYRSMFNTLKKLKQEGYTVDLPESVDALRDSLLKGNAEKYGTDANVHALVPTDDHIRRESWLEEIEAQWGAAPGKHQTNGSHLFVLGAQFGNVLIGIQPAFGYEGDPMRLLFEKGFAPTHAFSAFYRYLREDFGTHAVMHFGTHGALEFMPGKQVGMSAACWPERLIGDLPNYYLYAANNPSEGAIAKRRAAATLISYLSPALSQAGLYKGLLDLKDSVQRWRGLEPETPETEKQMLAALVQAQAVEMDMASAEPAWDVAAAEKHILKITADIIELEQTLIPEGLHVIGDPMTESSRKDLLLAMAEPMETELNEAAAAVLAAGGTAKKAMQAGAVKDTKAKLPRFEKMADISKLLAEEHELDAIIHALDARFVAPVTGGDLLRTPEILPTGRNLHGFDPFRMPSAFALTEGARQAEIIIQRHLQDGNAFPTSIALVLWGTDNLKSEGAPLAQALSLMGARPRFDSYGRLCGAELIPLDELKRPRIDVIVTTSGIFRDLLPMQTKLLAEAAYLAAVAEESIEDNFIRKHALEYQQQHGCDLETAALRVFSNADGAYGANVNQLIDSGTWNDEEELADTYQRRKCFAYGRSGEPTQQSELLESVLSSVDLTYQNVESVELGVTSLDHYFDTLGGISRSVKRSKGTEVPVYIGDQTRGKDVVRTLSEQVELETRTRMLNPKFYEGLLEHGYEGVSQIESHITNTMGWSATTGKVANWVYEQITQTYVLDENMRERLAALNPAASVKLANRLLEAHERDYWKPDEKTLDELRKAGDILEDRLEGIGQEAAA